MWVAHTVLLNNWFFVSPTQVKIGVSGGITFYVEIDFYDPFPETSGGLIRPFELLRLGSNPLEWFEISLTISITLSAYIEVGKFFGDFKFYE